MEERDSIPGPRISQRKCPSGELECPVPRTARKPVSLEEYMQEYGVGEGEWYKVRKTRKVAEVGYKGFSFNIKTLIISISNYMVNQSYVFLLCFCYHSSFSG